MDRAKKIGLVLAVVTAAIAVDRLWIHLIRWNVIGGWIVSLGRAVQG